MSTNSQATVVKESEMKITGSNLIRWTGLAAVAAGLIFAGIQPIHPPDFLSSVNTDAWAIITTLKTAMCLLFLVGLTGIYARQMNRAGWLGLAGFTMLIVSWWLQTSFVFAETFILPVLAPTEPQFVEAMLGAIARSQASDVDLGALPAIYGLLSVLYLLGGLLFGIATIRAGILSRWAAGLLAVASAVTPLAALLPHEIQRYAGIPFGVAVAWMGYAVWSERRAQASEPAPGKVSPQLSQAAAE